MSRRPLLRALEADINRVAAPGAPAFKQWVHVTIACPEATVAVNFSADGAGDDAVHRLITLVFTPGGVRGHARTFAREACRAGAGRAAIELGANRIADDASRSELVIDEPALGLRASLRLRPMVAGFALHNLPVGAGRLHWSVVPRLTACGTLELDGRSVAVDAAPAYRDRNWGEIRFGEVAWDWGYVLPDDPSQASCVVFARLLDAARARVLGQHVLVWSGASLLGSFRDGAIVMRGDGRASGPFSTVPPAFAVCRPGHASDVPERLAVRADASRGRVAIELDRRATARIVVPRDGGLGTSTIFESLCRARVTGAIDDEPLAIDGHGFLETVHA